MQTVETLNEGLKRAFKITIPAKEIDARIDKELKSVAPRIRMPGFRPGKVPANLVRKMHGPALEQEALNNAVQEGVQQLMSEQKLRPANQPSVELEGVHEAGKDVVINVALETLPDVPAPRIEGLQLERLTVEPEAAEVEERLKQIAEGQKRFEAADAKYAAALGDLVVIDYEGKVDGEAFDGGKGEGMSLELGSGRLIPGFEDQLVGARANEQRTVHVTFPNPYDAPFLQGRDATFDVTVNEVRRPQEIAVDDDFAKSMGLEGIDQLRGLIKGQVEQELNGLTRTHMKRKLLDQLAATHDFPVPPSMVEAEFAQIWRQLEHEATHEPDPQAAREEMEKERGEYEAIAERRVRLGLLLSEVGQANGVEISSQEMNQLVMQAAQQYRPADRQRFVDYVRNDAMAAAQLRAPLFEDKVVDYLFSIAEVTDRTVSRDVLQAEIEAEADGHVHGPGCGHDHDHDHGHDHAPKPKAKKAKAGAEPAPQKAQSAAAPEKKARAKKTVEPAVAEAPARKPAKAAPAKKEAAKSDAKPKAEAKPRAEAKPKAQAKPKADAKPKTEAKAPAKTAKSKK